MFAPEIRKLSPAMRSSCPALRRKTSSPLRPAARARASALPAGGQALRYCR
jgi:hypothetical protein